VGTAERCAPWQFVSQTKTAQNITNLENLKKFFTSPKKIAMRFLHRFF